MSKINQITVDGVTYDVQDMTATPRMLVDDKEGLESGVYDKTRYDAFRAKYPNRVYLERYKEVDGVEHEYIYNKVALTGTTETPEDFDTGEEGYHLDSVPLRLGGGQEGGDTWYRDGHIRVPALSVDEFPTKDDAKGFAIGRVYADSAILRNNARRLVKSADTLDDKCLAVESTNGVSSYLKFHLSNSASFTNVVFQTALWWDGTNATGGDIEFFLDDNNGNRGFLFYVKHDLVGMFSAGGNSKQVDMKPYMPFNKWVNLRIEFKDSESTKIYVDDTLVIEAGAGTLGGISSYVQFVASKAFEGKIALANVALIITNDEPNLTNDDYFDLDGYTSLPTSISDGERGIIRSATSDVWSVKECENFTGEGEYVVVNKKYLKKMLENAGSSGGGKLYLHSIYINAADYDYGVESESQAYISFYSTSPDPINTFEKAVNNATLIKNANLLYGYYNPSERHRVRYLDFTSENLKVYYYPNENNYYNENYQYDPTLHMIDISDTVTEV